MDNEQTRPGARPARHRPPAFWRRPVRVAALAAVGAVAAMGATCVPNGTGTGTPVLKVVGNTLEENGTPIQLHGADRSGTEYACVQGFGVSDGPLDAPSIQAMASWGINAVRVPLNEDCWLGINGVKPQYSGANYQSAIQSYVSLLGQAHMVAILDLHWNAPGSTQATGQEEMADADHSPAFWSSVASTFKSDPGVIFDLYNEPHDISWSCVRDGGCTVPAAGSSPAYQAAGMQQLVDAVRSTGATQPLMIAGDDWAGDLSQWLQYEPSDPLHQLVASAHIYSFSGCNTPSCWSSTIAPVAAKVPVVTGETGQSDCGGSFVDTYWSWADANHVSYLAWTWDTWGCPQGLVSNYNGTPTQYGQLYKDHLASIGA